MLIRISENERGKTLHQVKSALLGLDVGIHHRGSGEVWQRTPLTDGQKELSDHLGIKPPPVYLNITTSQHKG